MKKIRVRSVTALLMAVILMMSDIPLQEVWAAQLTETSSAEHTSSGTSAVASDVALMENDSKDDKVQEGNTESKESDEDIESTEGTENTESTENTEKKDSTPTGNMDASSDAVQQGELLNEETEEPDDADEPEKRYLINYTVVEKENLNLSEHQNVMVGIGEEDTVIEKASLLYQNADTGAEYAADASGIEGNAVSFSLTFNKGQGAGAYYLKAISVIVDGTEYTEYFVEAGIDAKFGVEKEIEAEPDAIVVEEGAEAAGVDLDVVTFDENGNQTSETSIESAIDNAMMDMPATASTYSLYSTRKDVVVVLDPGHDSTHAGAQANGLSEENLNLKIALYCKEELEKYSGVTVYMTRTADGTCPYPGTTSGDCNLGRVNYAQSVGADIYVSIHNNSAASTSAHGAMVFYPNSNYNEAVSQTGQGLAQAIQNKLVALGLYNRGITIKDAQQDKYPDGSAADYYGVIRNSKLAGIPAIIVEHTFMTNTGDVNNFLSSDERLKQLGIADATGIAEYYGLSKGLKITSANLSSTSYKVGTNAVLNYSVNANTNITVQVYRGDNSYLMSLTSNQFVGAGEHQQTWNLKGPDGKYVFSGDYRFTITATNDLGEKDVVHKYFSVTGNDEFDFKWTTLGSSTYAIGNQAELYYAVNKNATINVAVYDGNDNFIKTLESGKKVGTSDQVVRWDLTKANGSYVSNGTYRFTITAQAADGSIKMAHIYFTVTGNSPVEYKWVKLGSSSYAIGNQAELYYAVTKKASISVAVYDGNNNYIKALESGKSVGTNDQVARWDLKNQSGQYVKSGTYRFTITAVDSDGEKKVEHKYFTVTGNDDIAFKWTKLGSSTYEIGSQAELYYAVTQNATINVAVYDGNNNFLKTLESGKKIGTNDQVVRWDLTKANGSYVSNGTYRFTITAQAVDGSIKMAHIYFTVTGNSPVEYKWVKLGSSSYAIGNQAELYYAVTKKASISVAVYDGNNNYIKALESGKSVGTNDQVVRWDLKNQSGQYVKSGTYRFTITAVDSDGEKKVEHKYFTVTGNDGIAFKWTKLGSSTYEIGNQAELYYAVTQNATINVQVYDGNNNFLKALESGKKVGTNDQVVRWDLKNASGSYVKTGTYRFTITATDEDGTKIIAHQYFQVKGSSPVSFKWTKLNNSTYNQDKDDGAYFYYAVTRDATIDITVYYGDNSYMKPLVSNKSVATNDQVAVWDFKDAKGNFVGDGTYRFTITATDTEGNKAVAHQYFTVKALYDIMGTSNTTLRQMVAYYNANQAYPLFYQNSDAPTIEDFCRIYIEECQAENVRVEVAFAQAMKETGFLRFGGKVSITQYNFAGIGAVDSGATAPATFSSVREGVRAQVQHLKAYASTDALNNPCVDPRFNLVKRGTARYVEWLGINENPYGVGWATAKNYGYSIKNDYMGKLFAY